MILYHGSKDIIEKPIYGQGKKYNDYGLGFYCTDNIELAKEWGTSFERSGYANRYQIDCTELKILDLNDDKYCILHWLAILLSNREFDTPAGLALEAKEIYENDQKSTEIPGVKVKNKDLENCKVSIVEVIDEQGSKIMNKGIGKYVTLESNLMKFDDDESREEMITYLKDELVEILGSDKTKKTLVIGLGNWNITSDALGPKSVSKTLVTRHIFKNYNKDYDDDFTEVSALSPGVMGITGLETSETVKSIVDMIKPDRVIAIDALASRKMERVNSTIQISTAGISPGGGVGNKRKALNKDYLGVDVIAIGVPTVVDAATLTSDVLDLAIDNLISQSNEGENFYNMLKQLKEDEKYHLIKESLDPYDKNLIVTPKDIDETIENLSIIISEGLNRSLHPGRITN